MSLKHLTAAQLADLLNTSDENPGNTGRLSLLDEATIAFGSKYPGVHNAQRAFAAARLDHLGPFSSDEKWQSVMEAARRLAAVLRPLGSTVIPRCKRPAGWGTCDLPLDDDGQCRSGLGHQE